MTPPPSERYRVSAASSLSYLAVSVLGQSIAITSSRYHSVATWMGARLPAAVATMARSKL